MSREGVLIVNTHSRRGRLWFEAARDSLTAQGVVLREVYALRDPALAPEIVRREIARGMPLVIVGGGDGTLSAVVRHFIGSESVMGVLPLGTGNQFARDLGIPENIEAACRIVAEGTEMAVDVGTVEDDFFLTVTTLGLTAQVVRSLTSESKRLWGRFAYAFALMRSLRQMVPFKACLTTAQGEQCVETIQLVVGNGRFHAGPFPLSPDASITDGILDVYALTDMAPGSLMRFALRALRGRHIELPFVCAMRTERVRIETVPPRRAVVDGELQYRTPLALGVLPAALRVLTPAVVPAAAETVAATASVS
jgi:YegS/Rv2252/BmrU family lipid kinase